MTSENFIAAIRKAQELGYPTVNAKLTDGSEVVLQNLSGIKNGNKHDIWICAGEEGYKVLGRAYLGSKKREINLEGWPEKIVSISYPEKKRPTNSGFAIQLMASMAGLYPYPIILNRDV